MVAQAASRVATVSVWAPLRRLPWISGRIAAYTGLVLGSLALWQVAHLIAGATLMPGPAAVWVRAQELTATGALQEHVGISTQRLVIGWAIGCAISIPVGLTLAQIPLFRRIVDPYLNFFRFIPPIAYVSLMLIWFGVGEMSKVMLIIYTTSFTVTITTVAGALAIHREKLWASRSLGASPLQTLLLVRMPATIPAIVTGMRLAMATSFKTIIGAEMIGAKAGVGYMIWNSRAFLDFESIFLGIVALSIMGLLADFILRVALKPVALRYGAVV